MIELKPDQAATLADILTSQAANERVQITSLMASVERTEALAAKVSDGGRELDQIEIRLLADLVSGLERLANAMPMMFTEAGRAVLAEMRPQLDSAKAKLNH